MRAPFRRSGRASRALAVAVALLTPGCDQPEKPQTADLGSAVAVSAPATASWPGAPDFVARFLDLRQLAAIRLRQDVGELCTAVQQLTRTPEPAALEQARSGWKNAHAAYLAWQVFDFGFRDRKHALRQAQQLDAWPIMAGYIDSTAEHPRSGIVYDTTVMLDLDNLLEQHQLTDASEVSVGFHALEFLLWGEAEEGRRSAANFSPEGRAEVEAEVVRRRQAYVGLLCAALKDASRQVTANSLPEKILSTRIVDSLAEVIAGPLLEQRIMTRIKARVPEPECAFAETPTCGIPPLAAALKSIFLGDSERADSATIVGHVQKHPEKFAGSQLQMASENALGALENLDEPLNRDDLFAAEALTRSWLAEIRALQRVMIRPGSPPDAQP